MSGTKQFVLFLVAGGLAAAVNIGSRLLLSYWLPYVPSIVIAYGLGMATAFALNRQFVFGGARNALHQQMLWFVAINLVAALQTLLVSLALARWLLPGLHIDFHNETVAHVVGVLVPVVTSYLGHKHLSFSTNRPIQNTNG